MRLNKLDECLEDAQRALEIEPTYYWSLYRVTYVHYIRKDWDLAMEACDNFVELYPDKALPYLRRAYALGYRNEYSRAIADTNKALEIEWDNRDAKIYRAACYLDDRRYRNSFACYLDTWLDERDGKDTIRFLGTIFNGNSFSNDDSYRFMKNSEQRLEYVSRNLKEDRAAVRMLFHQSIDNVLQRASDAELLELQLKKIKADFFFKRYDDALKATVKLEEVDRNNLDLLLLKSECQLKLGLSVDALETAKALEALVVGDDDESARYRNAAKINIMEATHILVLENGGKTEGFLAEKQREREARMARRGRYSRELANVRNNPEDINAHLQAGFKIMRDSKQQSVALGYFTKALELIESSDSVDSQKVMQRDAYVNRGITYLNRDNSGDFVRARSDFQKATELFPDDAVAHQFLGVSLCLLGEFDDGQASLDRAQSLDSTLEVSRLARLILNSKDRNKSRVDADANELQDAASFKREWLSRRGFETTPYFKVPD
jgi:tetratricopeptide (TPR) repeat protein